MGFFSVEDNALSHPFPNHSHCTSHDGFSAALQHQQTHFFFEPLFFCWWSLLRYSSFRWVCGWHFISFRSLLHVTLTEARKYFPKQYPLHFHFFFWLYHHTGHSSFHRAYINMENLFDCGGSSLGRMRTKLYAFLLFLFCPPPDA